MMETPADDQVDRLSRSLLDFTRVLSLFEKHNVTFLVERLLAGWRPSHFVQGPLQEFVSGK